MQKLSLRTIETIVGVYKSNDYLVVLISNLWISGLHKIDQQMVGQTVTDWLQSTECQPKIQFSKQLILVEGASTTAPRQMKSLLERAKHIGAKVILLGDDDVLSKTNQILQHTHDFTFSFSKSLHSKDPQLHTHAVHFMDANQEPL